MWLKMNEDEINASLDAEIARRLKSKRWYFASATFFASALSGLLWVFLVYPAFPGLGVMSFVVLFVSIEVLFVLGIAADFVGFVRMSQEARRAFILLQRKSASGMLCRHCESVFGTAATMCPACEQVLVPSFEYRWLEDDTAAKPT